MNDLIFCKECNYAIPRAELTQARFDYECPNCGGCKISCFYSLNCDFHKKLLSGEGGIVQIALKKIPVPPAL